MVRTVLFIEAREGCTSSPRCVPWACSGTELPARDSCALTALDRRAAGSWSGTTLEVPAARRLLGRAASVTLGRVTAQVIDKVPVKSSHQMRRWSRSFQLRHWEAHAGRRGAPPRRTPFNPTAPGASPCSSPPSAAIAIALWVPLLRYRRMGVARRHAGGVLARPAAGPRLHRPRRCPGPCRGPPADLLDHPFRGPARRRPRADVAAGPAACARPCDGRLRASSPGRRCQGRRQHRAGDGRERRRARTLPVVTRRSDDPSREPGPRSIWRSWSRTPPVRSAWRSRSR